MKRTVIALKYAKGLFIVAKELNKLREFGEQLIQVRELFIKVPEALRVLESPIYLPEFKMEILEELLKTVQLDEEVIRFLKLLVEKGRIQFFKEIVDIYQQLVDEEFGILRGEVVTAYPLSEEEKKQLEEVLREVLKKEVLLESVVDKGIIGGIKVKVGDFVFDNTIKRQLQKFKEIIKGEVM